MFPQLLTAYFLYGDTLHTTAQTPDFVIHLKQHLHPGAQHVTNKSLLNKRVSDLEYEASPPRTNMVAVFPSMPSCPVTAT